MPSTYAHYRMGQEVKNFTKGKTRQILDTYTDLFNIGLHGPDILFYYKPLQVNRINQIGYKMHAKPGKVFFTRAGKIINRHMEKDAYLAYIYGFICHFALDITCHGYIDEKIEESGISHTEIEVEFDRALMIKDNKNPLTQKLTTHIYPTEKNVAIIKEFFFGTTDMQVFKALNSMVYYNNLLVANKALKRHLIYCLLKITGNYKEMHGLIVNYESNPKCYDSTKKLLSLYEQAKDLSLQLITEYKAYLEEKQLLNPIYEYTFGSKLPESEGYRYEVQTD